ncbi:hypothetical protein HY522_02385 [bacterium]|nr:hypothetical protein [bacterium]
MVKRRKIRAEARTRAADYLKVADDFAGGADTAEEFEYFNAAGVLYVHAAIAYADAVCIAMSGKKSASEDHDDVVDLLNDVIAGTDPVDREALKSIQRVISIKNQVSYEGRSFSRKDVFPLKRRIDTIRRWSKDRVRRAGVR